jgi:hypothetical protein
MQHVGGGVEPLDIEAAAQEPEQDAAGAAGYFERRAGRLRQSDAMERELVRKRFLAA